MESTETRTDIRIEWWKHHDGRPQPFGWRAVNRRNRKIVAVAGESFVKKLAMLRQVVKLFGPVEMESVVPPSEVKG